MIYEQEWELVNWYSFGFLFYLLYSLIIDTHSTLEYWEPNIIAQYMAAFEARNNKLDEEDWVSWSIKTVQYLPFLSIFVNCLCSLLDFTHNKKSILYVYYSSLRRLLGEGLGSCTLEELQQIEQQLERSVSSVRARKVNLISIYIKFSFNISIWLVFESQLSIIQNQVYKEQIALLKEKVSVVI